MEERNYSLGSVEHLHRVLHPVFEMAQRDCIIRMNPSDGILGKLKRETGAVRGVRKALTIEQQKAFLDFMDGHPVYAHWKPVFVFFIGTGVRVSELSGLTWKDIDFENGFITIDHEILYFAGRLNKTDKRLYIKKPKTEAGIRKIPLIKEVREALEELRQYQHENDLLCKVEIDGYSDFVFLNRDGGVLLQQPLDNAIKRIKNAYNDDALHKAAKYHQDALILPHFTCHSLRHTFCARLCENESNIKVIQSIMGHSDIGTTMNIYAEVSDSKNKQSLNAISDKFFL